MYTRLFELLTQFPRTVLAPVVIAGYLTFVHVLSTRYNLCPQVCTHVCMYACMRVQCVCVHVYAYKSRNFSRQEIPTFQH